MRDGFPRRQRRKRCRPRLDADVGAGVGVRARAARSPRMTKTCRWTPRSCASSSRISACSANGDGVIEYRERAPLVVPPSRDLPPPQERGRPSPTIRPGPTIPTCEQRKLEAAAKKKPDADGVRGDGGGRASAVAHRARSSGRIAGRDRPDRAGADGRRSRAPDAAVRARLQEHFQRHVLSFGATRRNREPSPASRRGKT